MKIGIVGGGMMGLTLAYRLSQKGHTTTVFEGNSQLGGLNTHHDYGPFVWDRFYHVILPSDVALINFIKDIGLGDCLRWRGTLTGFYVDQQMHSISNSVEFLRFPPLGLLGKIRLAFTLLYGSRIDNWRRLEQISVEDWLLRVSGKNTYQTLWKPLLLAKLGEHYKRVSAVFIWTYIKRLFSARDSSLKKEQLGYVSGGYKTVFDRLATLISAAGSDVRINSVVSSIVAHPNQGLWIEHSQGKEHFDQVIFTGPLNILQRVAAPSLINITCSGAEIEYLGVICMVLVTRKPLVPYYVVNIADRRVPFTGVIGMSNLVSLQDTAGLHLTYCPKYIKSDDPLFKLPDSELYKQFSQGIRLMFPSLIEEDIVSVHINRASKVQPLQVLHYSSLVPGVRTEHSDFFVLNTSQFIHDTLNNNSVVQHVDHFLSKNF
jgi:protoporphyrinogen oxidase